MRSSQFSPLNTRSEQLQLFASDSFKNAVGVATTNLLKQAAQGFFATKKNAEALAPTFL
jgi:hypothetical protein